MWDVVRESCPELSNMHTHARTHGGEWSYLSECLWSISGGGVVVKGPNGDVIVLRWVGLEPAPFQS